MSRAIEYIEGDRRPYLRGIISGEGDITGYNISILIPYTDALGGTLIVSGEILDGPNGEFEFRWHENDLKAGEWNCHIRITDANNLPLTYAGLVLSIGERKD